MSSNSNHFNERCNSARPKFAKYCSEPPPTDLFVLQRWTMSGAHLMMLEALQNIYNTVDNVPPAEEQNFALYCLLGTQTVEHHHHLEETVVFPMMAPEFTTNVLEEHAAFTDALRGLDTHLKSVLGVKQGAKGGSVIPIPGVKKEPYSAAKIKQFLDEMVDPLFTHLEHEIDWLAPEKIRASGLTSQRLEEIEARMGEHVQNDMDTSALVFQFKNVPAYCHFPPVPWFVAKILIPWVFWWKNRALWKFLPRSFAQP